MPIKIKLYLSMTFSSSTAGAITLILFSYATLTNVAYAQIFPNNQVNPTATPQSTLQQQPQAPSQPKLHLVKITSPAKGQQVPIGKDLTISGTSLDNVTSSDCKVSVKVNGISPYHDASGNAGPGQADYSKWNFTLTSAYTNIQPGPNKITAKFSCSNNPSLLSHNSVNVTGVAAADVAATNNNRSQQEQISSTATPPIATANSTTTATPSIADTNHISSDTNFSTNLNYNNSDNNLKPLSVSVHLGKNSLHPRDKQTITLSVADKNSTAAISGASVSGKITGPSGVIKKVEGTTDDKGKASYSWKVHNDYATGKYKVKIDVSDPGYENYSGSKTFKVTPIPVTVSSENSIKSNSDNNPTPFIIPSHNVNSRSGPDNVNRHHHIHHNNHSTIISSTSSDIIPSNNLIPQAVSPSTNTNTDTGDLHHPSTIIRSSSDNTEGNTNSNNDVQTSASIGVKTNNDMSLNSLSGSSTIAGNNLGIHIGGLAQKIINDVKNKLEKQGINIH